MTQQNLIHFDFYTGLGMSWSQNDIRNLAFDLVENRQAYGAYLKTGFRIWLPPRWTLEFEIEDLMSRTENFSVKNISHTLTMNLGLGLFFGSFGSD
jgi:hypothetical protein